jgi:hypothetical protein
MRSMSIRVSLLSAPLLVCLVPGRSRAVRVRPRPAVVRSLVEFARPLCRCPHHGGVASCRSALNGRLRGGAAVGSSRGGHSSGTDEQEEQQARGDDNNNASRRRKETRNAGDTAHDNITHLRRGDAQSCTRRSHTPEETAETRLRDLLSVGEFRFLPHRDCHGMRWNSDCCCIGKERKIGRCPRS